MTTDHPTWFIRHNAQREDVRRGAQNCADVTGRAQLVLIDRELVKADVIAAGEPLVAYSYHPPVMWVKLALIERNPTRAEAGT